MFDIFKIKILIDLNRDFTVKDIQVEPDKHVLTGGYILVL